MRAVLPLALALTLTACGGDEAPAVLSTDTVVVETPAGDALPTNSSEIDESDALLAENEAVVAEAALVPDASAGPAASPPPVEVIAENDARNGTITDALLAGSWRIVEGPGETISFENDGSFQLYIGDRLVEGGEWNAEEGILYLGPMDAYVIDERRATGMTFTGPNGKMILEHLAE